MIFCIFALAILNLALVVMVCALASRNDQLWHDYMAALDAINKRPSQRH